MRILLPLFLFTMVFLAVSCKGKEKGPVVINEITITDSQGQSATDDSSAQYFRAAIDNQLAEWKQSFQGFQPDSFRFSQRTSFKEKEVQDTADMKELLSLFGPSMVFTSDSSQYLDLFSAGISLERRGKKLVAMSDVDQAVTLCNLKTGKLKQIAFFGPSAGIEEAVWLDGTRFILAGTMHNDDGKPQAFVLIGDTGKESYSWYESTITRAASTDYTASGIRKLKIDEWE
ncbi:MAG: hypothetical protein IPG86_18470 [Chitinophagaceae bacterium]|nr:hypothetical protein [Chitinophagaceae bacterium]